MSNYEISKSSLLSLKAEILRKQEEVKNKVHENVKKAVPLVIKNKGIEQRNQRDTVEDLDLLEKSRLALEKKALLYEKLSKSKIIEEDPAVRNRFLVRFHDKIQNNSINDNISDEEDLPKDYDDPVNSDEEWVEYVDCLGRTRTCLKKDLQFCKSRDKNYKRDGAEEIEVKDTKVEEEDKTEDTPPEEPQLLSDDMRREFLRRQWEKEEEELRDKEDIHYQDVLFNEARTHGVSYYAFSKDEEVRKRQQESLEKLRKETLEEQKKSLDLKAMREKQLAARIRAAKMRKRERLGLPPEEEEEKETEIGPQLPVTEPKTIEENDPLKEKLLEEARKKHVRPWDIGKEKRSEFYEYTQEEWVEKKRNERKDEFAPPTTFRRDFRAKPSQLEISSSGGSLKFSSKRNKSHNEDLEDPYNEETKTFNPYKGASSKRKFEDDNEKNESQEINIEASIEAGLKFLRKQSENEEKN